MGRVFIGISGWRYEPWRGVFYPQGLALHHPHEAPARHRTVRAPFDAKSLIRKLGLDTEPRNERTFRFGAKPTPEGHPT